MIIALSGLPRVGKDTAAKAIKREYPNVLTYAFVDPLKKALCEIFGWSLSSFDDDTKDSIDPYWGISKRQMLEYIGSTIFRNDIRINFPNFDALIGDRIWVKRLDLFIKDHPDNDIIVTDLRFLPEYDYLKFAKKIYISRPNYTKLDTTKYYQMPLMKFDYELENTNEGHVEEFENKAVELFTIIKGEHKIEF